MSDKTDIEKNICARCSDDAIGSVVYRSGEVICIIEKGKLKRDDILVEYGEKYYFCKRHMKDIIDEGS